MTPGRSTDADATCAPRGANPMTLSDAQIAEWCNDAERDDLTTRAPSGYYPTARIFRLIEDRKRLIAKLQATRTEYADRLAEAERERDRHGPCICDTNPETTSGPDEFCPRHGRTYDDALDYMGRIIAHEREQATASHGYGTQVGGDLVKRTGDGPWEQVDQ